MSQLAIPPGRPAALAPDNDPRRALLVFVDRPDCRWLRWLRPGFRHCFVVLRLDDEWLACDPLLHRLELQRLRLPADFDLATFYVERGHRVLMGWTDAPTPPILPSLEPLTCVSVAKRALGLRASRVLTPWQLYRWLLRDRDAANWAEVDPRSSPAFCSPAGLKLDNTQL
jgi:hypothetical protein